MIVRVRCYHNMKAERSHDPVDLLLEHITQATPDDLDELARMQETVAGLVVEQPLGKAPEYICGVDVSYSGDEFVASAIVMDASDGSIREENHIKGVARFPYISGFFAYREVGALFDAVRGLQKSPDLVFCDGNGKLHPRRCGVACYLGILLRMPVIGISKKPPKGVSSEKLSAERGSSIRINGSGIGDGIALRTQTDTKPIYASVGNMISIECIIDLTLSQCIYRIPEPIRKADQESRARISGH